FVLTHVPENSDGESEGRASAPILSSRSCALRCFTSKLRKPNNGRRWCKRLKMVDLVGIEPTTSSMPWNWQIPKLLTAKAASPAQVAKNRPFRRYLTPI